MLGCYHVNSFSHGTMYDIVRLCCLVHFKLFLETLQSQNKLTIVGTISLHSFAYQNLLR